MLINEEVRNKISEIIAGRKIIEHNGDYFIFKIPDHKTKLKADLYYNKIFKQAIQDGIPTKEQATENLNKFSFNNEQEENLKRQLEKATNILKLSRHEIQKKEYANRVQALKTELQRMSYARNSVFLHTAEAKAEQYRSIFLMVESIFDLNEVKIWNSIDDFIHDRSDKNNLAIKYIEYAEGFSMKTMREISRHPEWIVYWRSCKSTSSPLFKEPVCEWDINKIMLVHWSQFYEDILSSPEPPSQEVLEDDDTLDKWLEDKQALNKKRESVTVHTDKGKIKTTYNVNQPYKLVTRKELADLKEEENARTDTR